VNKRFFEYYLLLALTATVGLLTCPAKVAAREPQTNQTLRNLQTAYIAGNATRTHGILPSRRKPTTGVTVKLTAYSGPLLEPKRFT